MTFHHRPWNNTPHDTPTGRQPVPRASTQDRRSTGTTADLARDVIGRFAVEHDGVCAVVVVGVDGLVVAWGGGVSREDAEYLAAIASGMVNHATAAHTLSGRAGATRRRARQVVAELDNDTTVHAVTLHNPDRDRGFGYLAAITTGKTPMFDHLARLATTLTGGTAPAGGGAAPAGGGAA